MIKHCHTEVARNLFGKQKNQHIKQLLKTKTTADPDAVMGIEPYSSEKKKKKKKNSGLKLKELNLGGGGTMYRTTLSYPR